MYGIFDSVENKLIGFFHNRDKADVYVAKENLNYDYDYYYVQEVITLDNEIALVEEGVKKNYNIIFNFPEESIDSSLYKESFYASELKIIDRKDWYTPYLGEARPISIKVFNTCMLVSVTADNYKLAVEEAQRQLNNILTDKNELLTFETITEKVQDWNLDHCEK